MSRTAVAWGFISLAITAMIGMLVFVISIEHAKEGEQGDNGALRYYYKSALPSCINTINSNDECTIETIANGQTITQIWTDVSADVDSEFKQDDRALYSKTTFRELTHTDHPSGTGIHEVLLFSQEDITPNIGTNIEHSTPLNAEFEGEVIISFDDSGTVNANNPYIVWVRLEYSNIDNIEDFSEVWAYSDITTERADNYAISIDLEKFNHSDLFHTEFEKYDLDIYIGFLLYGQSVVGNIDVLTDQITYIESNPGDFIYNQNDNVKEIVGKTNITLHAFSTALSLIQYGEVSVEGKTGAKGSKGDHGDNGALRYYVKDHIPSCADYSNSCTIDGNSEVWAINHINDDVTSIDIPISADTELDQNEDGSYSLVIYDSNNIIPNIGAQIEAGLPLVIDLEGELITNTNINGSLTSTGNTLKFIKVSWLTITLYRENDQDINITKAFMDFGAKSLGTSHPLQSAVDLNSFNEALVLDTEYTNIIGYKFTLGLVLYAGGDVAYAQALDLIDYLEENNEISPLEANSYRYVDTDFNSDPSHSSHFVFKHPSINIYQLGETSIEGKIGATGQQGPQGWSFFDVYRSSASDLTSSDKPIGILYNTLTHELESIPSPWSQTIPAHIEGESIYISTANWNPAAEDGSAHRIPLSFSEPVKWSGTLPPWETSESEPSTTRIGAGWYDTTFNTLNIYDTDGWKHRAWVVGAQAPANEYPGAGWYDTGGESGHTNVFKIYNGSDWIIIGSSEFELGNGDVETINIADNAVTSIKIDDGTIENIDVATNADIDGSKIADSSLSSTKLSFPVSVNSTLSSTDNGFQLYTTFTGAGASLPSTNPINWPSYDYDVSTPRDIASSITGTSAGIINNTTINLGTVAVNQIIELYFNFIVQNIILSLDCPGGGSENTNEILYPLTSIHDHGDSYDAGSGTIRIPIYTSPSNNLSVTKQIVDKLELLVIHADDSYECSLYADRASNSGQWMIQEGAVLRKTISRR